MEVMVVGEIRNIARPRLDQGGFQRMLPNSYIMVGLSVEMKLCHMTVGRYSNLVRLDQVSLHGIR